MTETTKKTRTTTARMTRTAPKNTISRDNEWHNDDTDNEYRGGGCGDEGGSNCFAAIKVSSPPKESNVHIPKVGSNASVTANVLASPPLPRI